MGMPVQKPVAAVLGLGLELYDRVRPDLTARLREQLDRFQAPLREHMDIAASRLCIRESEAAEAVREAEAQGVDALVLIPLCYTASLAWLAPLRRTGLPLIVWNTQELESVGEDYDFEALLGNHVMQGTQDVTSVLTRAGRVFGMESGHYRDEGALARIGEWARAARAARMARRLRVGVLGAPFADMGDFGADPTRLLVDWGPHILPIPVGRFIEILGRVADAEADRIVESDRSRYDADPGVTREMHRRSARLEIALRQLVEEYGLGAFSMNFLDLVADGRCPTLPFLGINKLMAEGLGYAGEGDALTAAFMAQLRQLAGAATFAEMYTADYAARRIVMTHMQECNPALARRDRRIRLVPKTFWAPGMQPYVGMHFTLEPGPVTFAVLAVGAGGALRVLGYETNICDRAPFAGLDIPHWVVQLDEPAGEFLTRYSLAGGPHHLAAAPGRHAAALRKLAALQGFGFTDLAAARGG